MSRIAQKIGLAGALIGALFTADMAKPTDAEAGGRRGYGGSSFSSIVCIGGCSPGFYSPFIPVRYVQPAVVSVPYYVPTAAYPATGAYFINGQPSTASASATATAQAQDIERIRREARDEGKEVGKLQAAVDYQGQQLKDLRDQLARMQQPTQVPVVSAPAMPQPAPAAPPPAYAPTPTPRADRAGEIPREHWMIAKTVEGLLIEAGGPGFFHNQRFGVGANGETTCYYDGIGRVPIPKTNLKEMLLYKYSAVVIGKETEECVRKRLSVLEKNPKLRSNVTVYELDPSIIKDYTDGATALKAVETWLDKNKIPRTLKEKAPVLVR